MYTPGFSTLRFPENTIAKLDVGRLFTCVGGLLSTLYSSYRWSVIYPVQLLYTSVIYPVQLLYLLYTL